MPQLQSLVRGKIGRMTFRSPAIALWIMTVLSFHECHGFIPAKTRQQRILVKAHKQHLASATNRYGPQSFVVLRSQQSNDNQDDVHDPEVETKTSETITKSPNNQILPSSITSTSTAADDPIRTTIGGGVDTIFEMARQMLLWDETEDSFPASSTVPGGSTTRIRLRSRTNDDNNQSSLLPTTRNSSRSASVLPRWHPIRGVSDANPSFRTSAPLMNSQGYAGTIWRNVRKANKPSLWRHALRTYDRMGNKPATTSTRADTNTPQQQQQQQQQQQTGCRLELDYSF